MSGLDDETRVQLRADRDNLIGKLPFSVSQYKVWAGMVDAALPPLTEDQAADALGGTEVDRSNSGYEADMDGRP